MGNYSTGSGVAQSPFNTTAQQQQQTTNANTTAALTASQSNLVEFNSDKSVLRVTTDCIPNSSALQKESAIPLGVIVKPYGDPITVSIDDS